MTGDLATVARRALGWSLIGTVAARLGTVAIGVALARLLGPGEFGAYAVALVALLAVLSFHELGVSLAVVRWPDEPDRIVPTVATLSVATSAVLAVGGILAAPRFAAAMGAPAATGVVRLLLVSVLVSGLVATPVALLQRRFQQGRRMIGDQVGMWTSAVTSILCAVNGLGAVSLAIGQLAGVVAGGALFVAFAPAGVRLGFDRDVAAELLRFGLPLAGTSIVTFAISNVDKVIVGAVLGPLPLGLYTLASNVAGYPASVLSTPVRSVAPAWFARLQGDPPALRAAFARAAGLLAAVAVPAGAVLAVTATPLVRLVYGAQWVPAAPVLRWLAVAAALRILFELAYDYLVVLARTGAVLRVQVLWLAALVPMVWLGCAAGGGVGAAVAMTAVAGLVVLPAYLMELSRAGVSLPR